MRVVVVTRANPVVTLFEAKEQLRVDSSDEDRLINSLVDAATAIIDGPEGWLGRAIGVQTLEAYTPAPALIGMTLLPYRPIIEIVSVEARVAGGGWADVDQSGYELRGDRLYFHRDAAPAEGWAIGDPEAMRVRYQAGYENAPPAIVQAILVMVEAMYRNRGSTDFTMPTAVATLLQPFRVYS